MKTLIIYHANCIDGITSAAVTNKYLVERTDTRREDIILCPMGYADSLDEVKSVIRESEVQNIYIVDFSLPRADLIDLYEQSSVLLIDLYDHHASAFRNLMGEDYVVEPDSREAFNIEAGNNDTAINIVLDNDECGASLCWKELLQTITAHTTVKNGKVTDYSLPSLIHYVKDYDLWRFTNKNTKAVNMYLKGVDKTVDNYTQLLDGFDNSDVELSSINKGASLLEYEDKLEDDIISSCVSPITINGLQGLAVNAPYAFASNIGHKLAVMSKSFGAVWTQQSDGIVIFSLRSNGDECDVSKLAGLMGGGGHKNAAGFTLNSPNYDEGKGITLWSERAKELAREAITSMNEDSEANDTPAMSEQEHEVIEEDGATNG